MWVTTLVVVYVCRSMVSLRRPLSEIINLNKLVALATFVIYMEGAALRDSRRVVCGQGTSLL
jgi:hypothetical protein